MDEYISREEAIKALYEVYEHEYPTASGDFDEYARHDVRNVLNGLPSADVQPVKHGRWEHGECSVCGASPLDHVSGDMYVEVDYYPNYCPSCGSQNVDLWVDDESVPNEDMRPDNEVI